MDCGVRRRTPSSLVAVAAMDIAESILSHAEGLNPSYEEFENGWNFWNLWNDWNRS